MCGRLYFKPIFEMSPLSFTLDLCKFYTSAKIDHTVFFLGKLNTRPGPGKRGIDHNIIGPADKQSFYYT